MRIKLALGKQRRLIKLAKADKCWRELAGDLHFNANYLCNELYKERRLLSGEAYYLLCKLAGKKFDKFILERLDENWGRIKGGRNSSESLVKKIRIPIDSEELAEFYGIMLGDGNLTRIKNYKIGTYQIRIVGDSRYDKLYLMNYVAPLIKKLFKVESKIYKYKNSNALSLNVSSRRLVDFLIFKGFKAGDKIRNQLSIPSWIKNNPLFLRKCLRGLYDTDGSVYKLTDQNSYQICFTNYNSVLLNDARNSLISFGIGVSKITKGRDITITKKSELRKFLNVVGFSNFKHIDKVNKWNLAP